MLQHGLAVKLRTNIPSPTRSSDGRTSLLQTGMKRPASELERVSQTEPELAGDAGDAGCESNPFAGISLFQSGASSLVSSTTGFPSNGTMTESGNPFMGLSLFSSPTSGKLFTAAVTTLQQKPPGDAGDQPKADCEAAEVAEAAEDAANEADDGESAGDEPTGEEDEEVIFRADCKLWKLVKLEDGKAEGWRWQERGCGIVHINRHKTSGAGRLVMRMRGVLKLLLNTPIFPTTRYEKVGQKSVRFVGVDTEESQSCHGEVAFCAFRLNLHSSDQQGKFLAVLREAVKA